MKKIYKTLEELNEIILNFFRQSLSKNHMLENPGVDMNIDYNLVFIEKMKEINEKYLNNELNLDNLNIYFNRYEYNSYTNRIEMLLLIELGENIFKVDEFRDYIINKYELINIRNKIDRING